jgi:hypothetical protein
MSQGTAEIRIHDSSPGVQDLVAWLRREESLRGKVRLSETTIRPGDMGAISGAVTVALGSGGAIAVLIQSLFGWVRHRQRNGRAHLTIRSEDGRTMELDVNGLENPDALIKRAMTLLDDNT